MAFMIKGIIDLKGILFLMLLAVTSQATNLDCYGKAFHCVNSTHFMICVDLGRGITTTIDDFIIPCPSPTVCRRTNRFECEFPLPFIISSTVATPKVAATLTTESEVTTFAPLPTISIPFEEYLNTVSTTTLSQTGLQPSPTDNILSVKRITGELDSTSLLTTEIAITEKTALIDIIPSNWTFSDRNLNNSSDINDNTTATLDFSVIPKNADSANNNQSTDSSKLNTEDNNVSSSTLSNITKIGSKQKENTQAVFITENIKQTVITPASTEKPVRAASTEAPNTVITQKITTEQYSAVSFQDVTNASTIDKSSTSWDTTIYFEPTKNVKQISESQLIRDTTNAAGDFNGLSEVSVTAPSIDVTSTVPGQTVSIEQYPINSVQEVNVNATVTHYITTLPNTNTPSGSSLDAKQENTGELDFTTLTATENVITEKSVLIDIIPFNRTFTDTNLNNPSDINANTVATSNFNVISTNADSVNNSQGMQITDFSKLNTEYNSLGNSTSSNITLIRSEQKENSETDFITENISKTVITPASTKKPVRAASTEVPNTVFIQKITTEQYSAVGFLDVTQASTIDKFSTLLDTTIYFEPIENVKQISESQLVRDTTNAAGDFNGLNEVSMTAPSIDVTSTVPGQTVSIEQYSTNSIQEVNVNATFAHFISTLSNTNTPSGSSLDAKQENTGELDSTTLKATENVITEKSVQINVIPFNRTFTDRNLNNSSDIHANTVATSNFNVITTNTASVNNRQGIHINNSSKLNTEYNNLGNWTSSNITTIRSEQIENSETVFTTENITKNLITLASTEKPVRAASTEVPNTEITQKITTEQYSAVGFQEVTHASTIDKYSALLDTSIYFEPTENVKQISESNLVRDTTNAAGDFNELNEVSVTVPSIDVTSTVPRQTVSTEKYSTNSVQEVNVNATATHYISTLPNTNTPLGSSLDAKQENTGELDSTTFTATENVITEKSVLIDIIPSNWTFTDRNLNNSSDMNANTVAILNFNVKTTNAGSVNNSQGIHKIKDSSKLNTEYNNLGNWTSSNITSIRSEQKENSETVFTTENITKTVITLASTEKPVRAASTEVPNTVITQKFTTEQYAAVGFQDVTHASTIDKFSTFLDTTIYFEPTENVKQMSELQLVRDTTNAADDFNGLNEVSVTAPSIDVTSTVPGQTVSKEQYSTNSVQEVNVNATVINYISTLPNTNTPSGSSLDAKQVNTLEPVIDAVKNITVNYGNMDIVHKITTNITPIAAGHLNIPATDSTVLENQQSIFGNKTSYKNTTIELTKTTEPISMIDSIKSLVDATNTTLIDTSVSENTFPTDTITEHIITEPRVIKEPLNATNMDGSAILSVTTYTTEQPHTAYASNTINDTVDSGSLNYIETNVDIGETTTNIITTVNELLVGNNLKRYTSAASTATDMYTISDVIQSNYQASNYQTVDELNNLSTDFEYVVSTETIKEQSNSTDGSVPNNIIILNSMTISDAAVTTDLFNTNENQNYNSENHPNNTNPDEEKINKQEFFTTTATVSESRLPIRNFENNLTGNSVVTVKTVVEDLLNAESEKSAQNLTSATLELYPTTERLTTILINNLEMFVNESIATPILGMSMENINNNRQNDAERIDYNNSNQVRNTTDRLTQNEVLLTSEAGHTTLIQAYENPSSKIESTTLTGLTHEPLPSILETLSNVGKTGIKTPANTNVMAKNVSSTDSAIPSTESLIAKPEIRNMYKISHNSSATLIDGQDQTSTASLLTPDLNATYRLYIDSLSSVMKDTDSISTYQYEDIITVTEVSILAHTAIVDTNKSLSSEQYVNISIDTPLSSPAPTIENTETTYVSSLSHPLADKTYNFDVTTIYNSNNQRETQTNSVLFTNNTNSKKDKVLSKNIDETTVKTDVFISTKDDANYTKESKLKVPKSDTTIKLSTTDTKILPNNTSTATPALKYNVRSVSDSTSSKNTVDSKLMTDKTNAMQRNGLDNSLLTTDNTLPDSSILISDSFQTITELNYTTESIATSEQQIKSLDAMHNFSIVNVQSLTEASITTTTNDSILNKNISNETKNLILATKSYLEHTKNTLENNLPILSGLAENAQNLNPQNSLKIHPTTIRSYAPATADNIEIMTDMPVSSENNANKRPTAIDTNNTENVIFNSSNSAMITEKTIGYSTITPNITLASTTINILRATTGIPALVNIDNNQNSTIKDDSVTLTNVNSVTNPEQQTNVMDMSDTFNSSSLVVSNQEYFVPIIHTDLRQPVVTTGEVNEVSPTSSLSDKNIRSTSAINTVESLDTTTIESTFNGEFGPGLIYSTANKDMQLKSSKVDDAIKTSKPNLVLSVISPAKTTTLHTNQYINSQSNENITTINMMTVTQFVTKSTEEAVPSVATTAQNLLNNDRGKNNKDNIPSANKKLLSVTISEIANGSSIVTTPILPSVASTNDSDTSLKPKVTTVLDDLIKAKSTLPINAEDPSIIAEITLNQSKTTESNIDSAQVTQTHSNYVGGSLLSTSNTFSTDINYQMSLKATENMDSITNLESTTAPTTSKPPGLVTVDDSQVLKSNIITTTNGQILTVSAFITLPPIETIKRKTNTNIETTYSDKDEIKNPEIMLEPTTQIIAPGIQNIASDRDTITSISSVVLNPLISLDFLNPTEVTTSDVLVDNIITSEKTHSGIISIMAKTSKLRESEEKKGKPETNETEDGEHRINVEFTSLQGENLFTSSTDIPRTSLNENGIKLQRNIETKEELLIKTNNTSYNTIIKNSALNTDKNIHNGTNTTVSGYKEETPTYELIGNSTTSTNNSRTSNNKSQDQNLIIPQGHDKSVISNDQSSTFPYMSQTKATAVPDTQTTGFPTLESSTRKTDLNNLFCKQKKRGRYADELDCRKFYICLGNKSSHVVEGTCPLNTVFSKINKQCTKNLSHCIRNNQFRCVTEGRFSDFLNNNIYYICVRNNLSQFIRFKLQCQNGYHLNKTSVRCVLSNESTFTTESKSASEQSSSSKNQDIAEKPEKKFKCKKEGVFPDPSNCKKYFECTKIDSSYRQKRKKCDSDEIFHKDKKKCVDSDSNEC